MPPALTLTAAPGAGRTPFDFRRQTALPFLRSLDTSSVDLVLTDPPYLISRETSFDKVRRGQKKLGISMDFGDWDKPEAFSLADLAAAVQEMARVLRPGGTAIIFFDLWKLTTLKEILEASGFGKLRLIDWIKTNPVPVNSKSGYLSNGREVAIVAVKGGKATFNSSYDDGVYVEPICRDHGRFHPTQKPLTLMKRLVDKHSNPGDLVIDPFAGSATTGVAALRADRRFAGCEPNDAFFPMAMERLLADGRAAHRPFKADLASSCERHLRTYLTRKVRALGVEARDQSQAAPVAPEDDVALHPASTVRRTRGQQADPVQRSRLSRRARWPASLHRERVGRASSSSSMGTHNASSTSPEPADGVAAASRRRRRRPVPLPVRRARRDRGAQAPHLPGARCRDARRPPLCRARLRHLGGHHSEHRPGDPHRGGRRDGDGRRPPAYALRLRPPGDGHARPSRLDINPRYPSPIVGRLSRRALARMNTIRARIHALRDIAAERRCARGRPFTVEHRSPKAQARLGKAVRG